MESAQTFGVRLLTYKVEEIIVIRTLNTYPILDTGFLNVPYAQGISRGRGHVTMWNTGILQIAAKCGPVMSISGEFIYVPQPNTGIFGQK